MKNYRFKTLFESIEIGKYDEPFHIFEEFYKKIQKWCIEENADIVEHIGNASREIPSYKEEMISILKKEPGRLRELCLKSYDRNFKKIIFYRKLHEEREVRKNDRKLFLTTDILTACKRMCFDMSLSQYKKYFYAVSNLALNSAANERDYIAKEYNEKYEEDLFKKIIDQ